MDKNPRIAPISLLLAALLLVPGGTATGFPASAARDIFPGALEIFADMANYTGTLSDTHNAETYKMLLNRTPTSVEAVRAVLTKTDAGGQLRIALYDSQGFRLAWNATVVMTPVEVAICAPYTDYVYIAVLSWGGAATIGYELNVTKSNLTANLDLLDGNNRPPEAAAVGNGSRVADRVDAYYDAGDFYSVALGVLPTSRDILTVLLAVPSSGDFIIELFREGNSSYLMSVDSDDIFNPDYGRNETLYYVPEQGGNYLVRIWAEHGAGPYTMAVRLFQSWQDNNNDPDNATVIDQDGTVNGNVSLYYDENEYYRIFLQPDTTIDIVLTVQDFDAGFQNPDINLFLMNSTPPGLNVINSSTSPAPVQRVGHLVTQAEWYYIRVNAGMNSAGNLTLEVTTILPPSVVRPEVNFSMEEDTSASVDLNAAFRDQHGRPLLFNFTPAEHLELGLNGSNLTISPEPDWNGHRLIDISAQNIEGKTAWAVVNLTVTPVNDAPVPLLEDLNFSSPENDVFELSISVDSLFSDIDGDQLDYSASGAVHLNVTIDGESRKVRVVPERYWNGEETFQIIATDAGGLTAKVSVTLNIDPVNFPPDVVWDPGEIAFAEHSSATVDLERIFRDPDGDPLNFSAIGSIKLNVTVVGGNATVKILSGEWSGIEEVTFVATDPSNASAGLRVRFNITPVNDAPYGLKALPNMSIREDTPTPLFNLSDYFRDPEGDPLSFNVTGPGALRISADPGFLNVTFPNITVSIASGGVVTFIPRENWIGWESLSFNASDPGGLQATLRFNLTVEAVDDAPLLSRPAVSPAEGDTSTTFTFTVVCQDIDSLAPNMTVYLIVGRKSIPMERLPGDLSAGVTYRVSTALPEGESTFYFTAFDGERSSVTSSLVVNVGSKKSDNTLIYMSLLILIILVIALALAFSPGRRGREWDEEGATRIRKGTAPGDAPTVSTRYPKGEPTRIRKNAGRERPARRKDAEGEEEE